jgi:hypothetical protein
MPHINKVKLLHIQQSVSSYCLARQSPTEAGSHSAPASTAASLEVLILPGSALASLEERHLDLHLSRGRGRTKWGLLPRKLLPGHVRVGGGVRVNKTPPRREDPRISLSSIPLSLFVRYSAFCLYDEARFQSLLLPYVVGSTSIKVINFSIISVSPISPTAE